jgi:hypothetical protein
MLLAIGAIIASISAFITFDGNLASAQIITTDISWLEDVTDSDDEETEDEETEDEETEDEETEDEETEDEETEDEETEPSESLTLRGLSRQGASDLAVACSSFLDC